MDRKKVRGQEKLDRHIIYKRGMMLFAKNYQNIVRACQNYACQSWRVFETHDIKDVCRNCNILFLR